MKNNLQKVSILLITLLTSVSCSSNKQSSSNVSSSAIIPSSIVPIEPEEEVVTDDSTLEVGEVLFEESTYSTHKYTVKVGANYIDDYKILVAEDENKQDQLQNVAEEIKYFVYLSSGVDLDIVSNNEFIENEHYISIGKTTAYKNAAVNFNDESKLGRSGVLIKSDKNNVYLLGGEPFGITYSAYEFLKYEIGLEIYGNNEYYYIPKTKLKVHSFNLLEVPDIELRICGYGAVANNSVLRNRMRFNTSSSSGNIWMGPDDVPYHNTFNYLSPSKYKASHPKWFSDDGLQLCFTAHGDVNEQENMFKTFMETFIKVINNNPNCSTISITQQDGAGWCECSACTEMKRHYNGADSAAVVIFCNKVSDALNEYFVEKGIKRDVDILFFAYSKTEAAPVKKDENGNWVPIDENVVCRDNVCCFYAPIYADYRTPLTDSLNLSTSTTLDCWQACTKKTYLWIYGTDFLAYLLPMNNFPTMGANYRFAFEHGALYMYDQGQWNQTLPTGWSLLKSYLQSKLLWNVNLDQNELIKDYFKHWFKDAYQSMLRLFNEWNTFSYYTFLTDGIGVPTFDDKLTKEMFPKSQVDMYLSYIEQAYKAIEPLKDLDPVTYERLYERILLESISYRYIDYQLYKSYYSNDQRESMWKKFQDDVTRLGISMLAETVYISTLFGDF